MNINLPKSPQLRLNAVTRLRYLKSFYVYAVLVLFLTFLRLILLRNFPHYFDKNFIKKGLIINWRNIDNNLYAKKFDKTDKEKTDKILTTNIDNNLHANKFDKPTKKCGKFGIAFSQKKWSKKV